MARKLAPLLVAALATLSLIAWQNGMSLVLTAEAVPGVVTRGEAVELIFRVENAGSVPLEGIVVVTQIPAGTTLDRTADAVRAPDGWSATVLRGQVWYAAPRALAPGVQAELRMRVSVLQSAGDEIVVEGYAATARGLAGSVVGTPLTVPVGARSTPALAETPTLVPRTATPPASPSPTSATPTPVPSATEAATPSPTPSPTITVVMARLPPTPTPVLTSEQEQLGALTVSIFVGITLLIAAGAAGWLVRNARHM